MDESLNASLHSWSHATVASPQVFNETSTSTSADIRHTTQPNLIARQAANVPIAPYRMQTHSIAVSNMAATDRQQLFQQRIEYFLHQRQQSKAPTDRVHGKPTQNVKLSIVKTEFKLAFSTMDALKSKRDQLLANIDQLSNNEWLAEMNDIREQQLQLQSLASKLNSPEFREAAQRCIAQRQERRSRIRMRKAATKQWKKAKAEKRVAINEEIDDRLRHEEQAIHEARCKADAAKRTEQFLSGVTKKKAEALRYVELFNALIELRRVRSVQSGRHDERRQQEFVTEIGRLKDVWLDAVVNYEREEKELNKWLSHNDGMYEDWCRVLFGTANTIDLANPILKGEHNFKELLRIRYIWDQCIVPPDHPLGSSIPIGWVHPSPQPTEQWMSYREVTAKHSTDDKSD